MRIGIVGAGAIGGLIGVPLARRGHDDSVLARGAALKALRSGSWTIERRGVVDEAQVRASDDAAELGVQDTIVSAVKGPALEAAARALASMLAPDTVVL